MKFSSRIQTMTQSIKWRVFFYYTLLNLLAVALLIVGFYRYETQSRIRTRTLEMQEISMRFMPLFFGPGPDGASRNRRPPPPPRLYRRMLQEELGKMEQEGFYLTAIDHNQNVKFSSKGWPQDLDAPLVPEGQPSELFHPPGRLLYAHQTKQGDRVVVGSSTEKLDASMFLLLIHSSVIGALIALGTSLFGLLIFRFSLKPISQISRTATRIAAGNFTERIDSRAQRSELGQLAAVLNQTFSQLEAALNRQVRFTADASHELRTPVAAILADCQYSLKRERPAERYLETIEVCHESAQHMKRLIESLGTLASFDSNDMPLTKTEFTLGDALLQAKQITEPLAALRDITLTTTVQTVVVNADERLLTQAVINLLANAVRFNQANGNVSLKCWDEESVACIEVSDTGKGIPPELQDKIFERFFRVDPSRNNKSGGSGLGLAITRTIVAAHGGSISVSSVPGEGSCFTIRLPLSVL